MSAVKQKREAADWRERLISYVRTLTLQPAHLLYQPSQISCLTSLSTASCHILAHLPVMLPRERAKTIQLSTVEPASICNTGSLICEDMKNQDKIKNSTGEWHVFHCSALQALRLCSAQEDTKHVFPGK